LAAEDVLSAAAAQTSAFDAVSSIFVALMEIDGTPSAVFEAGVQKA
jgi:hypothetical protein